MRGVRTGKENFGPFPSAGYENMRRGNFIGVDPSKHRLQG
jgi:hypothetical protein